METNVYDVTDWKVPGRPIDPRNDIGAVINSIIADIKRRQTDPADKPGAVIYIPPGTYSLKTRVVVDISFLTIRGSGHGFTSLSIRYNSDTNGWHERNPGGSHIRVENTDGHAEAFLVARDGSPRLSAIAFENFALDGVSFGANQNSYRNGKVGIRFGSDNDSVRVRGMGMVYLEQALVIQGPDALDVSGNFIAECGTCVMIVGGSQASRVADNHLGAGPVGFSIFAENSNGLLITGNNVFPRGIDSVHLKNCFRSNVSANRLQSFYPGSITLEGNCKENLISSNMFERVAESYGPFLGVSNGLGDDFGVVQVNGDGNTITANHVTYVIAPDQVVPVGATPAVFRVRSGDQNVVGGNHTITNLTVHTVVLDAGTTNSHVYDSGTEAQLLAQSASYGFRPTP